MTGLLVLSLVFAASFLIAEPWIPPFVAAIGLVGCALVVVRNRLLGSDWDEPQ